ncbi:hypothetical protein MMPV_008895 [Pyropia vietnamensis]
MKATHLASALTTVLLLALMWGTATAAVATTAVAITASTPAAVATGGAANVATLEGELSPAAAALLAAGRSRSPPIAQSRGKAAEYRRVGAGAPVPPSSLPPSLAAEVKEKADARAGSRGRSAKAKRAKGASAPKKPARKAAKVRRPRGIDRDAVTREVAAKAAALPIDAEVEATMHEVRSAMDRIVPRSKVGASARVATASPVSKRRATRDAVKATAKVAAATTEVAEDDRAALRERLAALEVAVLKVNKERDELRLLQSYAAEENRQLTIKLHEVQLALQSASRASGAANPALSRWLSAKELDLSAFVAGTAYEYYTRHSYGPLTAALISYGVLLGPLAASGLFFLRHAKALTLSSTGADLLTGVQAMIVFDAAFSVSLVAAIFVARLGDPLLALRDIAPPLFVFLFLAVAAQTLATVVAVAAYLRRTGSIRGHSRIAWALAIKLVVTADFFGRMGVPAVVGQPYIAPVPIGVYLAYVAASSVSLGLVHRCRRALVRTEAP